MSYINILKAGTDHTLWAKGLEFYRDELAIMAKRLLEISGRNSTADISKGVEHFQNQFIIQKQNISDLNHDVKRYVKDLSDEAKTHEGHVHDNFIELGRGLRERYEQLEQIMNGLRHEFNDFLSKCM